MAHFRLAIPLAGAVAALSFLIPANVSAQSAKNFELVAPQRLFAKTLKPHDPPLIGLSVKGWSCQGVGRKPLADRPIDWSDLTTVMETGAVAANPSAISRAEALTWGARYYESKRFVEGFSALRNSAPREFMARYFKSPERLQPSIVLDPAPGKSKSVYFHRCLTIGDLAAAKKAVLHAADVFDDKRSDPLDVNALPRGVTVEIRANRLATRPGLAQFPTSVGTGTGANGAAGTAAAKPIPAAVPMPNRVAALSAEQVQALRTMPRKIPVRRHESYLSASPPMSDFTGPGSCGQCRRKAMQACFVGKCGGYARKSTGMRNETVGIVTQLNALAAKYSSAAASPKVGGRYRAEWAALKRDLDRRDRAYHVAIEAEKKELGRCERGCQLAAAERCDQICSATRVGDRFSVPLAAESCQPVDTRLSDRPFEMRDRVLASLAGKSGTGRRIGISEYFSWKAAYETDPSSLQTRADRDPGSVAVRPGRRLAQKTTARVAIEPWFQPKFSSANSDYKQCTNWNRFEGVAVREADYELRGTEYDYDFYVYFTDLQGLEDFAEQYMRPFFSAGLRPEPGLDRVARSPVIAERLAKISDDAIGLHRGKVKAIGDTYIHTLRLAVDLSLNSGLDRVARASAATWNLGWSAARLSGQLLAPWMTSIQQKASGTFLESIVGADKFSALGIERLPQRHAYRMRVKGKRFWPDRVCQVPRNAYTEVTRLTSAGRHFSGLPNAQVSRLYTLGERNSCSPLLTNADFDGCWIQEGKQPGQVLVKSNGNRVTADIAYSNRRYSGWKAANKLYLEYNAANPSDRASMPWIDNDGKPTKMPAKVIGQAWPDAQRTSFRLEATDDEPWDRIVGQSHGVWIDYEENLKVSGVSPRQWPAIWKRQELKPKAVHFTSRDFADKVDSYTDPDRVFVRALVDNNCMGHIDRLQATVWFGKDGTSTEIDLVETTPFSGEFYSANEGIPVPPGQPGKVRVSLEYGLKGGAAELTYSTPAPAPAQSDFMKSLNRKVDTLKSGK